MKKVKWHLSIGYAGADLDGEFEVENDTTDDKIEAMAKEEAFNEIDWDWQVTTDA
jgi:hypothetical protein